MISLRMKQQESSRGSDIVRDDVPALIGKGKFIVGAKLNVASTKLEHKRRKVNNNRSAAGCFLL